MTQQTQPVDTTAYDMDQLAEWFVKNREWLAAAKKQYEDGISSVEETQDLILDELNRRLTEMNVRSAKTMHGTVVSTTTTSYTAQDPTAFGQWIIESGNFEATQLRPKKEVVDDYALQHQGQLPPGVGATTTRRVTVRKS